MCRTCINCNSDKTYFNKYNCPMWYKYKDGYLCKKCYNKLIDSPKWNPIKSIRRLRFKNKHLYLKENPRKGKCLECGKEIGDEYINQFGQIAIIKRTHLHHIEYHDDDPLKDTKELCNSCHSKETRRLEKCLIK